jgi:hypothetical protein
LKNNSLWIPESPQKLWIQPWYTNWQKQFHHILRSGRSRNKPQNDKIGILKIGLNGSERCDWTEWLMTHNLMLPTFIAQNIFIYYKYMTIQGILYKWLMESERIQDLCSNGSSGNKITGRKWDNARLQSQSMILKDSGEVDLLVERSVYFVLLFLIIHFI